MSRANARDEVLDANSVVVEHRYWPATRTGNIDLLNWEGETAVRPMNPAELAEWDAAAAETQKATDLAADDADLADIIATVLARLDQFTNFSGTANNTQLTAAVKDLSRILARIVRTLDRRDVI